MAGNESEAIKKSGIRGETKLFLGENGDGTPKDPGRPAAKPGTGPVRQVPKQ